MPLYWTNATRNPDGRIGGQNPGGGYTIRVCRAETAQDARDRICPGSMVWPSALTSPDFLARPEVVNLEPNDYAEFTAERLPNWRDAHGSNLNSRAYCEAIGYDPT